MGSKNIKVIKSKSVKSNISNVKEEKMTSADNGGEKKVARKITQNINNWIKEHRESKSSIQLPMLAN